MKLKEWRKKRKMTQSAMADEITVYVASNFPEKAKKLSQRTLACWETGTLPRNFWLMAIRSYTRGQVSAGDFVLSEGAPEKTVYGA